ARIIFRQFIKQCKAGYEPAEAEQDNPKPGNHGYRYVVHNANTSLTMNATALAQATHMST
ncbi:MAG: hypothetical protein KGL39_42860, partial [Patescibacteria group bacterium]|nr:hypothetical protein [Patescibacteria group bacterium]